MSLSLIVVSLGAVVAAVGTGALTARCARAPRIYLAAWTVAIFGLAIALGAQTLGYLTGYSGLMFRAMELGAQVLAPLGLCLGLAELVAKSVPARFAMRLAVSAIAIIALVILAIDPLNTVAAFSKHWPDPATVYDLVPRALIEFVLTPFAALTAIISVLVVLARSRHERAAQEAVPAVTAGAVAALAVAGPGGTWLLKKYVGLSLPSPGGMFAVGCLLAVALTWLAAAVAVRRAVGPVPAGTRAARRGAAGRRDQDAGHDGPYETGEFDEFGPSADRNGGRYDADELDAGYGGTGYGAADYRPNGRDVSATGPPSPGQDTGGPYPALAALAAEALDPPGEADKYRGAGEYGSADQYGADDPFGDNGGNGHWDPYDADARYGPAGRFGDDGPYAGDAGYGSGQDRDPGRIPTRAGYPPQVADDPHARLFGQIAIYTLIEERIDEFDRLTERVVSKVRAQEPDTLVYIVHAVPTAPMQRILYEVYRDRAAYDEHRQRPYVVRYETERRPFVLAANVIELGLQQAKVSPFPTISDILSESGVDLTGVTRSPSGTAPPGGGYPGTSRPPDQSSVWQAAQGRPTPGLPVPGPPIPGSPNPGSPAAGPVSEPGYGGWAELRSEDPGYR